MNPLATNLFNTLIFGFEQGETIEDTLVILGQHLSPNFNELRFIMDLRRREMDACGQPLSNYEKSVRGMSIARFKRSFPEIKDIGVTKEMLDAFYAEVLKGSCGGLD